MQFRRHQAQLQAFTVVELLTVIAIIAVLAGILFPVLARAKQSAKQTACLSNLNQLGVAFMLYESSYDGVLPAACDPSDKAVPQLWAPWPEWEAKIPSLPLINVQLRPYVKNSEVFRCPADTGTAIIDDSPGAALTASPSLFNVYGLSYFYRTEIAFRELSDSSFKSPANADLMYDGTGAWHGGRALTASDYDDMQTVETVQRNYRYNTLFVDGHGKFLTFDQFQVLASTPL